MSQVYNNYLFKCDLLYKQKKNLYELPYFKKITFKISLSTLAKQLSLFSVLKISDLDNQNKSFLLFYVNFFIRPKIQLKKNSDDFIMSFSLSKNNASCFLWACLSSLYHNIFNSLLQLNNLSKKRVKNTLIICTGNFLSFPEFRFYLNDILEILNIKKIDFHIDLLFKS